MKVSEFFQPKPFDLPPLNREVVGGNNPPSPIEMAESIQQLLSDWMKDHPVIQTEDEARAAKPLIDRSKAAMDEIEAERDGKVRPLNDKVAEINAEYKAVHNTDPKKPGTFNKIFNELKARVADYLHKEEQKRLAAAAEARRIQEEAERQAREAEEAAARAEVERKRIEQDRADAIARAERAEADRKAFAAAAEQEAKDAAEAAERNRLLAIENERKRVAEEAAVAAAATAKREADTKHRAKINNEVVAALEQILPSKDLAKAVVTAIAKGEIPHTRIGY